MISKEMLKEKKVKIAEGILKVLEEKNKRYGNAALEPINIFYKGTASNSILIRLDDKIQRIINNCKLSTSNNNLPILRKNDMFDLLGYLILLSVSEKYFLDENCDVEGFLNHVKIVVNNIFKQVDSLSCLEYSESEISLISSNAKFLLSFENIINHIKHNGIMKEDIMDLMRQIWCFFIINDITDFSDLID